MFLLRKQDGLKSCEFYLIFVTNTVVEKTDQVTEVVLHSHSNIHCARWQWENQRIEADCDSKHPGNIIHSPSPFTVLPGAGSSQEQGIGLLWSASLSSRAEEFLLPLGCSQGGSLLLFSEPKRERDQASQFSQGKVEFWNRTDTSVPCLQ